MSPWLLLVVFVGSVGVGAGVVALVRGHRRAAVVSAVGGLATALLTVLVYLRGLISAFDAVASAPAESKAALLAQGIAEAQWVLPVGSGLTLACVGVSGVAWWRLRRGEPEEA